MANDYADLLGAPELVPQDTDFKPEDETSNASYEQAQVHELARTSLDFLAALTAPHIFKYAFPPIFISAYNWLCNFAQKPRDFSKLALGLPRGFSKTTFIKVFLIYCILFTQKRYFIIINANEKLAIKTLTDICTMLSHPNMRAVFGDWKLGATTDNQTSKVFSFRGRTIIMEAIGKGGAIRGTNVDGARPDVMLFDDIQTREEAESEATSLAIENWMFGTAMKAKSPYGCLFIFLANMYPTKHSILRKLKKNPTWTKFIVGGILADGSSLWEELQPIEQLLDEFQSDLASGHPEIFYAEVLNDENANINLNLDLSKLPEYPWDDYEVSAGDFIIIDPSNDKANSDMVSIGHYQIINGTPVLRHLIDERLSPGDTIRKAYQLCFQTGASLIAVESVAFQYSLLYWFRVIGEQLQVSGIECVPLYPGSRSKNTRILEMFKELLRGEVYIHPEVKAAVHYQISQFNSMRRDNVDNVLDLLTYPKIVIQEYGQFIQVNTALGSQEFGEAKVLDTDETCSC